MTTASDSEVVKPTPLSAERAWKHFPLCAHGDRFGPAPAPGYPGEVSVPRLESAITMIPKRTFLLTLIGVCLLSAAVGSGITLLAQQGPAGPPGERGPQGERGPPGPEGSVELGDVDVEELESKIAEVEEAIEGLEVLGLDAGDLDLSEIESGISDVCETIDIC